MNIYECEEKNKIIFPQSFKDILNKAEAQWLEESMDWILDNEDELRGQIAFGFPSIGDFDVWANDFEELIFTQLAWEIIDDERDKDSDFIKKHAKVLSSVYVELLEKLNKEELERYVYNIQLPECPKVIV